MTRVAAISRACAASRDHRHTSCRDAADAAIAASYGAGVTDEFMLPAVVGDYAGMKDGDGKDASAASGTEAPAQRVASGQTIDVQAKEKTGSQ